MRVSGPSTLKSSRVSSCGCVNCICNLFEISTVLKLCLYCENSHLGHNEGTLAMKEGEVLYIIEEDKGDGWTRARRQNGEEGYVPTSYIDVTLEKNSKGAVTYI